MALADKPKGRAEPRSDEVPDSPEAYEADVYTWALQQAAFLRARDLESLDTANLADEIMDVVHYLADKLEGDLKRVLQHLLKWDHQQARRTRSWTLTIREHRRRIAHHLRKAPGLRASLPEILQEAYAGARDAALDETDLPEGALPTACPYSWDEIMTRDIAWPEQP